MRMCDRYASWNLCASEHADLQMEEKPDVEDDLQPEVQSEC
jgi:hypothetical protein